MLGSDDAWKDYDIVSKGSFADEAVDFGGIWQKKKKLPEGLCFFFSTFKPSLAIVDLCCMPEIGMNI